ncbi:formylglycine-generating enzyme family protein [Magnetospirillum fulvum]|uniref:Formylglycine-generating enzyme, required for sulfatase activity, contains SUMF1/FGE domain n=1 Tax=Magnetospirillum fulvum TaxID=1082 RepID=A0A1H6I9B5_MAGFU|nr:SUMF1/EgtB/PvdO family nonheme iron enzyme [Magnetospirillum fulvum]SEH42790.1 Formylglycine-generating enzyme, required for sulfatase activity, contains SUMF1/FGE domain [Magnetospirillum fulvum]
MSAKVRFLLPILLAPALAVVPLATAGADGSPCPSCPPLAIVPAAPPAIPHPFALTRTEISFDQWRACVAERACPGGQDDHGWGRGHRPVINVTWDDATAYAGWLGAKLGRVCRLPTEVEWEHAARAGTTTGFWWGESPDRGRANCRDCLGDTPPYGTRPVASFAANPWGLYDMNGNVWEWTASCARPISDRGNGAECRDRVIKGGSWYYYSKMSRAESRASNDSRQWSYNIGIRVLCEIP